MTESLVPPRVDGYDWPVDASKRLEQVTNRRAQIDQAEAEEQARIGEARRKAAVYSAAMGLAEKNGVDLAKVKPATEEDFARKDRELHREHLARQAAIRIQMIPSIFHRARLNPSEVPEHHIARHWLDEYRSGVRRPLVVLGTCGVGKTYVAAALAMELATQDHIPVTFTTEAAFAASMRQANTGAGGMEPDMALYMLAPVLVLDDLGADRATPWSLSQLLRLMHHRSHNALPTIITSNLKPDEIREHCGRDERLVQRLAGGAELITMAAKTRRAMPTGF